MSRLTPEREAEIRQTIEEYSGPEDSHVERERDWLDTIDVLRVERDEAILGAYRAAADAIKVAEKKYDEGSCHEPGCGCWFTVAHTEILALTPQSALDAVERREHAFELIEKDPHQWSSRPCSTCCEVSEIIGKPFGCSAKVKRG